MEDVNVEGAEPEKGSHDDQSKNKPQKEQENAQENHAHPRTLVMVCRAEG